LFFALLFLIGSMGVAASAAGDTVDYTIRRNSPGVSINDVYGQFSFEAGVPVEKVYSQYRWTVTVASFDGTNYVDTGVTATWPDGFYSANKNKLTVNLNYGAYFIGFIYLCDGEQSETVYAPLLFVINQPADKTVLKALVEKKGLYVTEVKYTKESFDAFQVVLTQAEELIANYEATQAQVDDMVTNFNTAYAQLVVKTDAEKGSFASFFMVVVEIIQYILNISRDKDLGELFTELKQILFER
jgi:hypothetical protein